MTAAVVVVVVVVVPCSWSCLAGPSWLWRVCWKKIKYSRHCLASSLRSAALGVRELLRSFCGERIECMLARRSICLLCLLAGGSHDANAVVAPSAEQTRRWTYDALKKNKATIKKKEYNLRHRRLGPGPPKTLRPFRVPSLLLPSFWLCRGAVRCPLTKPQPWAGWSPLFPFDVQLGIRRSQCTPVCLLPVRQLARVTVVRTIQLSSSRQT